MKPNRIVHWRIERGLNQWELSQACELPRWLLQLIERGHRLASPEERKAIAMALSVSEETLFPIGGNDESTK